MTRRLHIIRPLPKRAHILAQPHACLKLARQHVAFVEEEDQVDLLGGEGEGEGEVGLSDVYVLDGAREGVGEKVGSEVEEKGENAERETKKIRKPPHNKPKPKSNHPPSQGADSNISISTEERYPPDDSQSGLPARGIVYFFF